VTPNRRARYHGRFWSRGPLFTAGRPPATPRPTVPRTPYPEIKGTTYFTEWVSGSPVRPTPAQPHSPTSLDLGRPEKPESSAPTPPTGPKNGSPLGKTWPWEPPGGGSPSHGTATTLPPPAGEPWDKFLRGPPRPYKRRSYLRGLGQGPASFVQGRGRRGAPSAPTTFGIRQPSRGTWAFPEPPTASPTRWIAPERRQPPAKPRRPFNVRKRTGSLLSPTRLARRAAVAHVPPGPPVPPGTGGDYQARGHVVPGFVKPPISGRNCVDDAKRPATA